MSKNNVIIALVVLCLVGTIWGSVQDKKSKSLQRQIAAMNEQTQQAPETAPEATPADTEALSAAQEQVASLTAQNKELLEKAATLKGTIAGLKKEMEESGGAEAVAALQEELDKKAGAITTLEESIAAAKADLDEKIAALAAAESAAADFEEVKNNLANAIDTCSEKSQALVANLEDADLRIAALEKALEERSKLLVSNGQELSRTKLNMNVLLSRIAAQNNSLAILEETRISLEKELTEKLQLIEALQAAGGEGEDGAAAEEAPAPSESDVEAAPAE